MSDELDLTLPATAPASIREGGHEDCLPTALYTLVNLTDPELEELQRVCESGSEQVNPDDSVRLPPQARFAGEPLRAVYDYHLQLGSESGLDPIYFIVATHKDWKKHGVLLVTLDDDELVRNVDSCRVEAKESGLLVENLQIANMDWDELKENFEIIPRGGNDSGNDGDNDDGDDDDDDNDDDGNEDDKNDGPFVNIGVYILEGLDAKETINTIEPAASIKSPSEFCCRLQATLSPNPDPVKEAARLHPANCSKNNLLVKDLLLVADTMQPEEDGLALVHITWDGIVEGRTDSELDAIGASATVKTQRVPFTAYDAVQYGFLSIKDGDRPWEVTTPLFMVFCYNSEGGEVESPEPWLDSEWEHRREGEARVKVAPTFIQPDEGPMEEVVYSFEESIRRFPALCRRWRFTSNLSRHYFMLFDNAPANRKTITLAKLDWDGNVRRNEEELMALQLDSHVTLVKVPVREGYATLAAVVQGEKVWEGEARPAGNA